MIKWRRGWILPNNLRNWTRLGRVRGHPGRSRLNLIPDIDRCRVICRLKKLWCPGRTSTFISLRKVLHCFLFDLLLRLAGRLIRHKLIIICELNNILKSLRMFHFRFPFSRLCTFCNWRDGQKHIISTTSKIVYLAIRQINGSLEVCMSCLFIDFRSSVRVVVCRHWNGSALLLAEASTYTFMHVNDSSKGKYILFQWTCPYPSSSMSAIISLASIWGLSIETIRGRHACDRTGDLHALRDVSCDDAYL